MLSIRMRASKSSGHSCRNDRSSDIHISGAEGIFDEAERTRVVRDYIERAIGHPRGRPDRIVITIEFINDRPQEIKSLPLSTLRCRTTAESEDAMRAIISSLGVSGRAIDNAFRIVRAERTLRGAAIVRIRSGRRADPDRERGIRATRIGIERTASRLLSRRLGRLGVDTPTVREALLLASKVSACPGVIGELCVSDDPDYTTGYVASVRHGYVRVPHIKRRGEGGGRVFFVREDADIKKIISFLEQRPVLISDVSGCHGTCTLDDILCCHNL